ncbi:uncharacterized protein [Lepeophtheirus salmonis]|uniref:uncharacterized protein n=1 Tax=Lepeophtheirus salmonis TaxID=72036 RepID=UPI001AE411F9|nr:nuclear cap-binding protein subunit 3-like [Lepeophtheirus salmonis]
MEVDGDVEGRDVSVEEGEEEMEEGEISSDGDDANLRELPSDFARRPKAKGELGLEITISNKSELPDLLKEIGNSGVDVIDRESSERMEARARRFNLKSNAANFEEIENLYTSLEIDADEVTKNRNDRNFRLETIHVYIQKSNRNVQSKDIYEYFKEFNPVSFEWVTSHSINVIWALPTSASKAMLQMSRPLKEPMDAMEINVKSDLELISDGINLSAINHKFDEPYDSPIYTNEIGGSIVIPEGVWRFGKPSDFSSFIFMQFASKNDNRRPNYSLIKQEGIISSSLKRKMREAMIQEQEILLEQEQRKKYLGPVGKNPWGSIAESWSDSNSKRTIPVPRDVILPSRVRDWDDPDKEDNVEHFGTDSNLRSSKKRNYEDADIYSPRKRISEDICEPEFITYESNEGLSDDEWKSKLKRPRMTMIADQVESKVSAKTRLYKGIKRKFKNDERTDIRILEIEDFSPPRINPKDLRERITLSVDTSDFNRYKDDKSLSPHNKTLTNRFHSGFTSSNLGSSLRDRLGERKASYSDINDSSDNDSHPNLIDRDSKYNKRTVSRRKLSDSDVTTIQRDVSSTVVKVKREQEEARQKIDNRKKSLLNVHEKRSHLSNSIDKKVANASEREKNLSKHLRERDIRSTKKVQRKQIPKGRRRESTSSESSSSSESDSSSSDSSSESDSSDSSSSSSSSYSSSSSGSEDGYVNKSYSKSKGTTSRTEESYTRKKSQLTKIPVRRSKEDSKKNSTKSTGGLRDKLKEYLKQAKERKKPK